MLSRLWVMTCIFAFCSVGFAESPSADFIPWGVKASHPLGGVTIGSPNCDFGALAPIAAGAQIFGLGEAAHAQHDFTQMRIRLFDWLSQEQGYTALVMETGAVEGAIPNAFIQGEAVEPKTLLLEGFTYNMGPWLETLGLLLQMKKQNEGSGGKVRFYGMDQPGGGPNFEPALSKAVETVQKLFPGYSPGNLYALALKASPPNYYDPASSQFSEDLITVKEFQTLPEMQQKEYFPFDDPGKPTQYLKWNSAAFQKIPYGEKPRPGLVSVNVDQIFELGPRYYQALSTEERWSLGSEIGKLLAHSLPPHSRDDLSMARFVDQGTRYLEENEELLVDFIAHPREVPGVELSVSPPSEESVREKFRLLNGRLRSLISEKLNGKALGPLEESELTYRIDELVTWLEIFQPDLDAQYGQVISGLKKGQELDLLKYRPEGLPEKIKDSPYGDAIRWARHTARVTRQSFRQLEVGSDLSASHLVSMRVREAAMLENIHWILETEQRLMGKAPKVMVYAHNSHLSKDRSESGDRGMGSFLATQYGQGFKLVKMTGGKFLDTHGELAKFEGIRKGSFEEALHRVSAKVGSPYFLDLSEIPSTPSMNGFLGSPMESRVESWYQQFRVRDVQSPRYSLDGVIYFEQVEAGRFITKLKGKPLPTTCGTLCDSIRKFLEENLHP